MNDETLSDLRLAYASHADMNLALDEIERLRAALREVLHSCERWARSDIATVGERQVHGHHAALIVSALAGR